MLNPSSQNSWFLSQFLNCHWYSARIFYGRFSCTHMNALNSEEEDIYRSGHGVWVWTLWLAWGDIVWETLMSLYLMCLSRRKSCLCVLLQNLCYGPYLSRVLKLSRQEPDLLLRLILSVLYFSSSPSFFFFFPLMGSSQRRWIFELQALPAIFLPFGKITSLNTLFPRSALCFKDAGHLPWFLNHLLWVLQSREWCSRPCYSCDRTGKSAAVSFRDLWGRLFSYWCTTELAPVGTPYEF